MHMVSAAFSFRARASIPAGVCEGMRVRLACEEAMCLCVTIDHILTLWPAALQHSVPTACKNGLMVSSSAACLAASVSSEAGQCKHRDTEISCCIRWAYRWTHVAHAPRRCQTASPCRRQLASQSSTAALSHAITHERVVKLKAFVYARGCFRMYAC